MLQCPVCRIPLCRIEYENVPIHICPDCRGSLVDMMRFRAIAVRREKTWTEPQKRRIEAETAAQAPMPLGQQCPKCLMPMKATAVPMGGSAFRIEVCQPCELLWFDRGQLDLAQILYEREQDALSPEDRGRVGGAARVRLPMPDEKEKPLDAWSPVTPPTLKQYDISDNLGLADRILRMLAATTLHTYPWWPWMP